MRFVVNTYLSASFNDILRSLISAKVDIELHHSQTKKDFVKDPLLAKANVNSIQGTIRDYKYLIFLADSLNSEYILFNPEKSELKKLQEMIELGKKKNINIAIENTETLGRTPTDIYNLVRDYPGLKFVFNPTTAKACGINAKGFMKMLKDEIIGVNISDYFKEIIGLPYSLGESDFLDPVIEEFMEKNIPFVMKLDSKYDMNDALISIDKMKARVKGLKKSI